MEGDCQVKLTIKPRALEHLEDYEYPDLLTVKDVRTILGIGRVSVYHLIESEQVKALRTGQGYKIPKKEIKSFLKNRQGEGTV